MIIDDLKPAKILEIHASDAGLNHGNSIFCIHPQHLAKAAHVQGDHRSGIHFLTVRCICYKLSVELQFYSHMFSVGKLRKLLTNNFNWPRVLGTQLVHLSSITFSDTLQTLQNPVLLRSSSCSNLPDQPMRICRVRLCTSGISLGPEMGTWWQMWHWSFHQLEWCQIPGRGCMT